MKHVPAGFGVALKNEAQPGGIDEGQTAQIEDHMSAANLTQVRDLSGEDGNRSEVQLAHGSDAGGVESRDTDPDMICEISSSHTTTSCADYRWRATAALAVKKG